MLTLSQFLADVELRAFQMARISVGDEQDALDIVQDAMTRLVSHYASRHSDEWRPLFFRILQRRITDWHRRRKLRQWLYLAPRTELGSDYDDDLDRFAGGSLDGERALGSSQISEQLVQALQHLPLRQQQCFLLRCWEGLSVAETAEAMGCSQGSVKTHYSRALNVLRQQLEELR